MSPAHGAQGHAASIAVPVHAAPAAEGRGLAAWLTTVDHKRIGLLYGTTALAFLLLSLIHI